MLFNRSMIVSHVSCNCDDDADGGDDDLDDDKDDT